MDLNAIDLNTIVNGIIANAIYGLLGLIFIGFLGFRFYKNRNIRIKKSKISKSFKGPNKDVEISESEIKDSFN